MTPAERADVFERALRPALRVLADPASNPEAVAYCREALRKVTALIDALHGLTAPRERRSPGEPGPHDARARARGGPADEAEAARLRANAGRGNEGLHGIRRGRRQCEATTRRGARCKAPAIPGGSVCRRHGGEAPQARMGAAMMALYEARYNAGKAWEAARGTPAEFDALCAVSRAEEAVRRGEAAMDRVRELRAELRNRKPGLPAERPGTPWNRAGPPDPWNRPQFHCSQGGQPVAKVRQARRCSARRADGQPCRAYAIAGGAVCRFHGGAAPAVRHRARVRLAEAVVRRVAGPAYDRWRREVEDWHVRRWLAAASVLGVSPAEVTPGDVLWLVIDGQLPAEDSAPKIRYDRRYGPRSRAQLATRAARQAARSAGGA